MSSPQLALRRIAARVRQGGHNVPRPQAAALRRSARVACKTARAHGTPIYIWRNGKVIAEKP